MPAPPAMARFCAAPVSRVTTDTDESARKVQLTVAPLLGRDPFGRRVSYRHDTGKPFAPISMFDVAVNVCGARWIRVDSMRVPARSYCSIATVSVPRRTTYEVEA